MIRVKKYDGSAVGTPEQMMAAAAQCAEDYRTGDDVVVILSSPSDAAEALEREAAALNPKPPKRERDMLLATDQQRTASLMAIALDAIGIRAVSLNAFQTETVTIGGYGSSRIRSIDTTRILHELEDRRVVIVTGGQGINRYGDVATLGSGGADATAVALSYALKADTCEIYTEKGGVYTADPAVCPGARLVKELTYDELMELNLSGHPAVTSRSVELAKRYGITLVLRSLGTGEAGTTVREERDVEQMIISSVTLDESADRISVIGLRDEPGVAFRLFSLLAKAGINIDLILQSFGHDGLEDICFTVADPDADRTMQLLEDNQKWLKFQRLDLNRSKAKLTAVGAGLIGNAGCAAKLFEALYNEGINIDMITTSEIRMTVLIDRADGERAVRAVHDAFGLGTAPGWTEA